MPETNDDLFFRAFQTILAEVFHSPSGEAAFLLNPGDPGLLRQRDAIGATAASARCAAGETTVAAGHVCPRTAESHSLGRHRGILRETDRRR